MDKEPELGAGDLSFPEVTPPLCPPTLSHLQRGQSLARGGGALNKRVNEQVPATVLRRHISGTTSGGHTRVLAAGAVVHPYLQRCSPRSRLPGPCGQLPSRPSSLRVIGRSAGTQGYSTRCPRHPPHSLASRRLFTIPRQRRVR